MIKKAAKNIIGSVSSSFDYPIIVNSYGRSGSTVLTKSIIKNAIKAKNETVRDIAFRSISQSAWDLEDKNLRNGIVYKTHDYPPARTFAKKVRMLYTFADPVDVVLSLMRLYDERGEEWMRQHYQHLKLPFGNFKDILEEDQLKLEQHLDSWLNESRFPIAFIKYEKMWDYQDEISKFLEFDIKLPAYKKRKSKKLSKGDNLKILNKTYRSLRNKIDKMDNFFIHNF